MVLLHPRNELVYFKLIAAGPCDGCEELLNVLVGHLSRRDLGVPSQGRPELMQLQRATVVTVVVLEQGLKVLPCRRVGCCPQASLHCLQHCICQAAGTAAGGGTAPCGGAAC